MKRRIPTAAALALVLLVGSAAEATAHDAKFGSIVEIQAYLDEGAFLGVVGSFDNKKCSRNRRVTVWRENPGAMDGPFGTTRTDRKGQWRLDVSAPAGTYYATVKKRTLKRSSEHRHVCKSDRSPKFRIA